MRDRSTPPVEFVSYVEGRISSLRHAVDRIVGDEAEAHRLTDELMNRVALRWRRLQRQDVKLDHPIGTAADEFVDRLLKEEFAEDAYPHANLNVGGGGWQRTLRSLGGSTLRPADEAQIAWENAQRMIRRRLLIAGAAVGGIVLFGLCSRDKPQEPVEDVGGIVPRTPGLPTGLDGIPARSSWAKTPVKWLAADLKFPDTNAIPDLSASPLTRAVALFAPALEPMSPVFALDEVGHWRKLDKAPTRAGLWLEANALSPDGRNAAFADVEGVAVVDIRTGKSRVYAASERSKTPVWLNSTHLLVGRNALLDIRTGKFGPSPARPEDLVTPRGEPLESSPKQLVELASQGIPLTAPARIVRWTLDGDSRATTTGLNGPGADLVGPWTGAGFAIGGPGGLLVRVCSPAAPIGSTTKLVVVIHAATGAVRRILAADERPSSVVRLLGWAGPTEVLLNVAISDRPGDSLLLWNVTTGFVTVLAEIRRDGVLSLLDPMAM